MADQSTYNFDSQQAPQHFDFGNTDDSNDALLFSDENEPANPSDGYYKILVVDDEEDVHSATRLILDGFRFNNRRLELLHAYSATQAYDLLVAHPDIALAFLDVVMEKSDSGLMLVRRIREEMGNKFLRIVLRTGQPGYAPERRVVLDYDINDYKTKTELTANKVITVLVAGLRAYDSLVELDDLNRTLQQRVDERTHELQEKNQLLDTAIHTQNKLFSIIGHDLRGPIGNVKAMLEVLVNQPNLLAGDNAKPLLMQLHKNASQTYTLLENLLLWARNEQGEAAFNPERFDLNLVLYETVALLEAVANEKQISIRTNIHEATPIHADQRMMATVVRNLLSNAIKFSHPNGLVEVQIQHQPNMVEVAVRDYGVGIAPDDIRKILDPQVLHITYGTKSEKGSGLGINLCRTFLQRNGSELHIESEPGQGSRFSFQLPLAPKA